MARYGVLTGGGDCPGLNAVICGVVVRADQLGHSVIGFRRGWEGLLNNGQAMELEIDDVEDIQLAGGTILGASRTDPLKTPDGEQQVLDKLKQYKCDGLIVVGGDETLKIADKLSKKKVKVVGIPKTLDNNLNMTDYTFGFVTACNIATESIERLRTSAKSRDQVIVAQVLGRNTGWIAMFSGLAGGANLVLIPEIPFEIKQISDLIKARRKAGKEYSIITVAEGAVPKSDRLRKDYEKTREAMADMQNGGGIASWLSAQIRHKLDVEARSVVLGPVQRAGSPTAFDRMMGLQLGSKSVDLAHKKKFGVMAAIHGTKLTSVPLSQAVKINKTVPSDYYEQMKMFFR